MELKKLQDIYLGALREEGVIGVNVVFCQEQKDFIVYLSRSLGMIQGAINSFVEEVEKE